jgi:predicted ATP-dependent endonuclease of OLD family
MKNVWRVINKASREFNVQVFATTHSRECIVAAHEAMEESGDYDFRLHRLERVEKKVKVTTLGRADLSSIIESGFEVR